MERETGIEPASLAWKARVLPLNYSRKTEVCAIAVQRLQLTIWWRGLDSNQCRRKPTDLQSAPFSHSGTPPRNSQVYQLFCARSQNSLSDRAPSAQTGAAGGDRTHDPWLRRPILYPLSYSRMVHGSCTLQRADYRTQLDSKPEPTQIGVHRVATYRTQIKPRPPQNPRLKQPIEKRL